MMPSEETQAPYVPIELRTRIQLIDYISPETDIRGSQFALMFASGRAQLELIDTAFSLFRTGHYETLVIAGSVTRSHDRREASEIANRFLSSGLSRASIVLEEDSPNTGESLSNTRNMLNPLGVRELLLIGNIYAKRRYAMTIKKQWPEIERISCATVNCFGVGRTEWWKSLALTEHVLEERRRIKNYLRRGYLSEVEVIDRQFRL